jgi:hypothetical protein
LALALTGPVQAIEMPVNIQRKPQQQENPHRYSDPWVC